MKRLWSGPWGGLLLGAALVLVLGCGGEHTIPIPVEKVGATTNAEESMAMDLDARGYLNGVLMPELIDAHGYYRYPVSYIGSWTIVNSNRRAPWYLANSVATGATANVVGTMTRVIFDFLDHRQYQGAGKVSFWVDGRRVSEFSLARDAPNGQAIMDYMVYTGKTTLATVSLRIETGRAIISGYRLIFPARNPSR